MKHFYSFLVFFFSISLCQVMANDTINVPHGSDITLDGYIMGNEWSDAQTVTIPTVGLTVYYKHNGQDLHLAFEDVNGYGYSSSTGIYLDLDLNGGTAPATDDLWIHGSAAAFEFVGNDSIWVQTTPSLWSYKAEQWNEYRISLSKLNVDASAHSYMGVLFSFLDWSVGGYEITWPDGGVANVTLPDAWAVMHIEPFTVGLSTVFNPVQEIHVYPNPCYGELFIERTSATPALAEVLDATGRVLHMSEINEKQSQIALDNLPQGLYVLRVRSATEVFQQKIILNRIL